VEDRGFFTSPLPLLPFPCGSSGTGGHPRDKQIYSQQRPSLNCNKETVWHSPSLLPSSSNSSGHLQLKQTESPLNVETAVGEVVGGINCLKSAETLTNGGKFSNRALIRNQDPLIFYK
jgi:hypothetical protein